MIYKIVDIHYSQSELFPKNKIYYVKWFVGDYVKDMTLDNVEDVYKLLKELIP